MKLSKIALTVIVAAAVATPALRINAADSGKGAGAYMTLDGGVSLMQDIKVESGGDSMKVKMDPGFRIGLIGGYNLNEWAGVELESGFIYNSVKDSNSTWLGMIPVLGNFVVRYQNDSKFVPYLGVGAGGAFTMVQGGGTDKSDFVFAYQAKLGVAYKLSDKASLDLTYKFFGTGDQKYDSVKVKEVYSHFIGVGITWNF